MKNNLKEYINNEVFPMYVSNHNCYMLQSTWKVGISHIEIGFNLVVVDYLKRKWIRVPSSYSGCAIYLLDKINTYYVYVCHEKEKYIDVFEYRRNNYEFCF